ncbi:MAG TPA: hypothetical protein VFD58_10780 [Blastocatellia bacterium]|nr:hypothetical protein [Blastocatellia bacterium]
MSDLELVAVIKKFGKFFEAYERKTFTCYRNAKDGGIQKVLVEVLDAGPENSSIRYSVIARSEDGKAASGNPGSSPDMALAMVHWGDLDSDHKRVSPEVEALTKTQREMHQTIAQLTARIEALEMHAEGDGGD